MSCLCPDIPCQCCHIGWRKQGIRHILQQHFCIANCRTNNRQATRGHFHQFHWMTGSCKCTVPIANYSNIQCTEQERNLCMGKLAKINRSFRESTRHLPVARPGEHKPGTGETFFQTNICLEQVLYAAGSIQGARRPPKNDLISRQTQYLSGLSLADSHREPIRHAIADNSDPFPVNTAHFKLVCQ